MAATALAELHDTHTNTISALSTFAHMKIYELLRIDVNIHYMLSQLYILQRDPVDNKAHIQVIMTELSKFSHQRELELKLNTGSFPELDRMRIYGRRTRGESSTRGNDSWPYPQLIIKHKMCRNILCGVNNNCTRFHGTYTDHILYLRRCSYKLLAAPDTHICGDACVYYHNDHERDQWAARYATLTSHGGIGIGPPVVK